MSFYVNPYGSIGKYDCYISTQNYKIMKETIRNKALGIRGYITKVIKALLLLHKTKMF